MAECCTPKPQDKPAPKRHACPVNGNQYLDLPYGTVLQHIKEPWRHELKQQSYYFCDDPDCDVVYFGLDNSTISKTSLRTTVGIKEKGENALICYCFGVSKAQARTCQDAKAFVIAQTKSATCTCVTSNPSGRCCLKDFPK